MLTDEPVMLGLAALGRVPLPVLLFNFPIFLIISVRAVTAPDAATMAAAVTGSPSVPKSLTAAVST